eukprot:6215559-Amphidinium_carterae.1
MRLFRAGEIPKSDNESDAYTLVMSGLEPRSKTSFSRNLHNQFEDVRNTLLLTAAHLQRRAVAPKTSIHVCPLEKESGESLQHSW